jgi:hypothetical protein
MLGSSDWISDTWCERMMKEMNNKNCDMLGKRRCAFLDTDESGAKRIHIWNGYAKEVVFGIDRVQEPIGIGRLISRRILDKMDWNLYNPTQNNSMDRFSYDQVLKFTGNVNFIEDRNHDIMSVSLSFPHLWRNKHKYEGTVGNATIIATNAISSWLKKYFPNGEGDLNEVNTRGLRTKALRFARDQEK